MANKYYARATPANTRVVPKSSQQRLRECMNIEYALASLPPVGLVAKGMYAHVGEVIVNREPG